MPAVGPCDKHTLCSQPQRPPVYARSPGPATPPPLRDCGKRDGPAGFGGAKGPNMDDLARRGEVTGLDPAAMQKLASVKQVLRTARRDTGYEIKVPG